jgi:hypothetical protein
MKRKAAFLVFLAVFGFALIGVSEAASPPDLLNTTWVGPVRAMMPDGSVVITTGALTVTAQSDPLGLYAGYFDMGGNQPVDFTMQISTNKRITMAFVSPQPGFHFIADGQMTRRKITGVFRYLFGGVTYEFTLTKQ